MSEPEPGPLHERTMQAARHARVGHSVMRYAAWVALVCWAVMSTLGVVALALFGHNQAATSSRAARAAARSATAVQISARLALAQHELVVQNCERQNVKQAEDNRNQQADFLYDRVFLVLIRPTSRTTRAQRREIRRFTGPLLAAERAKSWVPLVPDCTQVSPTYRPPMAVPFYQQMPPSSALEP